MNALGFATEEQMRVWLRGCLQSIEGLNEIVLNPEILEPRTDDSSQTRAIRDSFGYCKSALHINEVVTDNEDISLADGEVLKPDFVLYAVEDEAMVIVELKNLVSPSRQAGTELSAYAGELRSHLPFLSDGDVVNVLISSVWPTLLRHYVAHEIVWIGRKIICMKPVECEQGHKLEIVDPALFADGIDVKVSSYEMGGHQLCLYDDGLYGGGSRTRLDANTRQMRATLQMMAARGNALRSHGFAFLWKDRSAISLAPYSITMVQAAPFQGVAKFLPDLPQGVAPRPIQKRLLKLVGDYDPAGHSKALSEVLQVARRALGRVSSPRAEGFTLWPQLREMMDARVGPVARAELIAFAGWGRFGDSFADHLIRCFGDGELSRAHDDPELGLDVIAELLTDERPIPPGYYGEGEADEEEPQ